VEQQAVAVSLVEIEVSLEGSNFTSQAEAVDAVEAYIVAYLPQLVKNLFPGGNGTAPGATSAEVVEVEDLTTAAVPNR
jgi:hypothetical protein